MKYKDNLTTIYKQPTAYICLRAAIRSTLLTCSFQMSITTISFLIKGFVDRSLVPSLFIESFRKTPNSFLLVSLFRDVFTALPPFIRVSFRVNCKARFTAYDFWRDERQREILIQKKKLDIYGCVQIEAVKRTVLNA